MGHQVFGIQRAVLIEGRRGKDAAGHCHGKIVQDIVIGAAQVEGDSVLVIHCDLRGQHIELTIVGAGANDRLHIVEIELDRLGIEGGAVIELHIVPQMEGISEAVIRGSPVCRQAGQVLTVPVFDQSLIEIVHVIGGLIGLYAGGKSHGKIGALRNGDGPFLLAGRRCRGRSGVWIIRSGSAAGKKHGTHNAGQQKGQEFFHTVTLLF